jgi:hypothetical protein
MLRHAAHKKQTSSNTQTDEAPEKSPIARKSMRQPVSHGQLAGSLLKSKYDIFLSPVAASNA